LVGGVGRSCVKPFTILILKGSKIPIVGDCITTETGEGKHMTYGIRTMFECFIPRKPQ